MEEVPACVNTFGMYCGQKSLKNRARDDITMSLGTAVISHILPHNFSYPEGFSVGYLYMSQPLCV
jgi:hypothetical protein